MYQTHDSIIHNIYNNWKKSWFQYFFAFTDLAMVLNRSEQPDCEAFINAYLNSWAITRYFFKYFIDAKEQKPFDLYINTIEYSKKNQDFELISQTSEGLFRSNINRLPSSKDIKNNRHSESDQNNFDLTHIAGVSIF